MKNNNFKLLLFVGFLASTSHVVAKPTSKATFDAATIQIEIFKDRSGYELDFVPENEPSFKQFVLVTDKRQDPPMVQAYLTATGDDHEAGILDGWAETPAGYYTPDKLATKYKYYNDSGSASTEPWGIYFLDFADLDEAYVPKPLRQKILEQGDHRNIIALHTYSGPFGSRRSHGCGRSPQSQIAKLWKRALELYVHNDDFLDSDNDLETSELIDASVYPAIAVYGSEAYVTKNHPQLGTLKIPEENRSQKITQEEAARMRALINATL